MWRYQLRRIWDPLSQPVAFVGLNPSTADETRDDPTVRRCIGFARRWGYGGLIMANAFAFRATDPRAMMAEADPVGPDNNFHLRAIGAEAALVVAALGARGAFRGRSAHLAGLLGDVAALGLTKNGEPRHPLYVRGDAERIAYVATMVATADRTAEE